MAGRNGGSKSKKKGEQDKADGLKKITSIFEKKVGVSGGSKPLCKQDGQQLNLTNETARDGTSKSIDKNSTLPAASAISQKQSNNKQVNDKKEIGSAEVKTPSLKRQRNISSLNSTECDRKKLRDEEELSTASQVCEEKSDELVKNLEDTGDMNVLSC